MRPAVETWLTGSEAFLPRARSGRSITLAYLIEDNTSTVIALSDDPDT